MKTHLKTQPIIFQRIVFLVGIIASSLALIFGILSWGASASVHAQNQQAGQIEPRTLSADTIYIEFPYVGGEPATVIEAIDEFASLLSTETGLDVQASVQNCMANVVRHLGEGMADAALLNIIAYISGHDQYGIEAVLVNERYGDPYYKGQINVLASMGYTSLWDLQDKTIAFPNDTSTSGYLAPYLLISETTGMAPEDFFSEIYYSGSHDQVIRDVYTGTVDCGGSYWDARENMEGEYPDVMSVVDVLTTTEPIPNDTWAFRPGFEPFTAQTLKDGIIAVYGTAGGQEALAAYYGSSLELGISTAQDSDYDFARRLISAFGWELLPCSEQIHVEFPYTSGEPSAVIAAADDFASLLSLETGLDVQASVQLCASNVVKRLGEWKVDVAPLTAVDYVYGHDQYGIQARLVNGRFGLPYYKGQINVPATMGYTSLWDLQDKKIAFPNDTSTSGYLAPYLLISETTGMEPDEFFSEIHFSGSHQQVIRDVYTGTVDCGGSYWDARPSVEEEYPDVMSVVEILTTTEPIPNDGWAFHTGMDPEVAQTLASGIISVSNTTEGDAVLDTIFDSDITGIESAQDSDYDIIRRLSSAFDWSPSTCEGTIQVGFPYTGGEPAEVTAAANEFASLLSQETGFDVNATVQHCMARVVEHLGENQVDLAPISGVAYVIGHDQYGIDAGLVNERFGSPNWMGQINVPSIMGYTSILDLQGKTIAFPGETSFSGYLAPYLLISDTTGIQPEDFFSEISFSGSHPQVIRDVYTGAVDCGGSYWDARPSVASEYPDVMSVVDILTTTEPIPNDPWAFRPGMDLVTAETLNTAIIDVYNTYEGREALETLITSDLSGISVAQDSDYDYLRRLVSAFGLDIDPCNEVYLPLVLRLLTP